MFGDFLMKKMLAKQGVPASEAEKMITLVKKDPEFFKKVATEIQEKTKTGVDQMVAAQEVLLRHKDKIQELLGDGGV